MRTIEKIISGCLIVGALAGGFYGKKYLDSLGKYNCMFTQSIEQADATNPGMSQNNVTATKFTSQYVIQGRCDYDFGNINKENKKKELENDNL